MGEGVVVHAGRAQDLLSGSTEVAFDRSRHEFEESRRGGFEDGQGQDFPMQMQRDVSSQLVGKLTENLRHRNQRLGKR